MLEKELSPANKFKNVNDVRVLGAIGVIEMKQAVDMKTITEAFVNAGLWVRPFGKLIYLMPPYIINDNDLRTLASTVVEIVMNHNNN